MATAEPKSAFTRYLEDEDAATASVAANRGGAVSTASVAGPDAAKALDNDVRKFTDYLKAYLPSRTCFKVPHTWWGTSPFVTWDQGSDVLSSGSFK